MNILLHEQEGGALDDDRQLQNQKIFYQNYDYGIHVDRYDSTLRRMTQVLVRIVTFNYSFYEAYCLRSQLVGGGQEQERQRLLHYFMELKVFIKKLAFRIEISLNEGIFNHRLKNLLKLTQAFRDQDIVQMIF